MARFTAENEELAREIIARYPVPKSATDPAAATSRRSRTATSPTTRWSTSPSCSGSPPAEVLGTASFYEMFKREPVGKYVVNVCTYISCFLNGGDELLEHAEERLGIKAGGTTADGLFTLEGYECIAACTEAPCLQVNYRYFHKITNDEFDRVDRRPARRPPRRHPAARHARPHPPAHRRRSAPPASPLRSAASSRFGSAMEWK